MRNCRPLRAQLLDSVSPEAFADLVIEFGVQFTKSSIDEGFQGQDARAACVVQYALSKIFAIIVTRAFHVMQLVVSGSQKNRPSRDFRTHAGASYCEQIVPGETFTHAGTCLSVLKPEMPVVYKDIFSKHKLCRYAD